MIDFNTDDYHIAQIKADCHLGNMLTKHKYWVYGLAQGGNENPIRIKAGRSINGVRLKNLTQLMNAKANKLGITFAAFKKSRAAYKVHIGLRRDLRDHVPYCSAILQTIIYHLEGRLELKPEDLRYQIPGVLKTRSSTRR